MINGYTIRNADATGTLVEYHDDSGLSYSLNLVPAFNEDNSPMNSSKLTAEIMRHTLHVTSVFELKIATAAATTLSLPLNSKQTITAKDLEDFAAAVAAEAARIRIEPILELPLTKL